MKHLITLSLRQPQPAPFFSPPCHETVAPAMREFSAPGRNASASKSEPTSGGGSPGRPRSCRPAAEAAWQPLLPTVTRLARRMARRWGPGGGLEADDLAQEVWLRLFSRAGGFPVFSDDRSAQAYVSRVVASVVLSHRRARFADRRGGPEGVQSEPGAEIEAPGINLEERAIVRQAVRGVEMVLRRSTPARLRGRNATVLRWVWFDGEEANEVSSRLGGAIGPSGVNTLVCRARSALRRAEANGWIAR